VARTFGRIPVPFFDGECVVCATFTAAAMSASAMNSCRVPDSATTECLPPASVLSAATPRRHVAATAAAIMSAQQRYGGPNANTRQQQSVSRGRVGVVVAAGRRPSSPDSHDQAQSREARLSPRMELLPDSCWARRLTELSRDRTWAQGDR
jgi:hypothetical protein